MYWRFFDIKIPLGESSGLRWVREWANRICQILAFLGLNWPNPRTFTQGYFSAEKHQYRPPVDFKIGATFPGLPLNKQEKLDFRSEILPENVLEKYDFLKIALFLDDLPQNDPINSIQRRNTFLFSLELALKTQ